MGQNTNRTKYKNSKIQTGQNTKGQNKNCQNTNGTKYKCNKTQMEQNTNRTKWKNSKKTNTTKYKRKKYKLPKCKCNNKQMHALLYLRASH